MPEPPEIPPELSSETPPDSIERLTRAIGAGDTNALGRFYRQWFDWMYGEARRACGRDESFCLDVVQETMMRLIRTRPVLRARDDLERWLRRVVRSSAYDLLRRERRMRARHRARQDLDEAQRDDRSDQDLRERIEWLRGELASMDGRDSLLLHLRHRLGWTLERIGGAVELSAGAVDGRLRRIALRMKQRYEETCHDHDSA